MARIQPSTRKRLEPRPTMEHEYKSIEILELQVTMNLLSNDVLGRYVTNPRNLPRIRAVLRNTFRELKRVRTGSTAQGCPPGWNHTSTCACTIDPTYEDLEKWD